MRRAHAVILSLLLLSLSACALFPNRDPVNINVVGLEPLPSQDLEAVSYTHLTLPTICSV